MLVRAFARRHGHTDDMFVPVRSSLLSVGDFMSTLKKCNSWDVSAKDNHFHHIVLLPLQEALYYRPYNDLEEQVNLFGIYDSCAFHPDVVFSDLNKKQHCHLLNVKLPTLYYVKILIFPPFLSQ